MKVTAVSALRRINKKIFRSAGIMMLLWLLLPVVCTAATKKTETKTVNVIRLAKKNEISDGQWEEDSKGMHYRKKPTKKNPQGERLKDAWVMIDDNIYYFNKKGTLEYGWFKYQGKQYASDIETGQVYYAAMVELNGAAYGFRRDGVLACKEWLEIDLSRYYFNAKGKLQTSKWIGNRYVGSDGAVITGLSRKRIRKNASKSEEKKKQRLIIVGASRVCHMQDDIGSVKQFTYKGNVWNTLFICRRGMGYDWLVSEAAEKLRAYLELYPRSKVVFQLGNNDYKYADDGRINEYIAYYRKLMRLYPKATFYFMDILPSVYEDRNQLRELFNLTLKENFPQGYIGGYDFLMQLPFNPDPDGGHYKPSTGRALFNYIREMVGLK